MQGVTKVNATVMATLLVVSLVGVVTVIGGVGMADAAHPEDAPDLSEEADLRVGFPGTTDNYPGDMNEENGSIEYFAKGAEAFGVQDAEEGVFIDWIIVHAEYEGEDWIDYSACDTPNTEAFGIDRGDNNEGTEYDVDLVARQKQSIFRDDGIVIEFLNWEDIANDPPYMAPEDSIVAAQGAGSAEGPCLTLTDEPGWYRIAAFMNGTVADNGPDQQPSEDAGEVSLELNSNYLYVCDCEDEQEAREQLGDPPSENGEPPEETPTPTPEDPEEAEDTPTPTPEDPEEAEDTPTPTPEDPEEAEDTPTPEEATEEEEEPTEPDEEPGDEHMTPTPGDGPGFGAVAALVALLASALLVRYRR